MHHFFVEQSNIIRDEVVLSTDQAHQVCHVLRLKAGDSVVVLDNAGYAYDVTLTTVMKGEVVGRITERRPAPGEPKVQITLFQSLLARDKFEWVLQKGTEVGVCRFVPVATARSIVRARQIDEKKLSRWRKIVTEAAEQSHRGRVPEITPAIDWTEATAQLGQFHPALIAAPGKTSPSLKQVLSQRESMPTSLALLIGPEGGFTGEEVDCACHNGAIPVSLGPRILRTETAGMMASALVLYELGDLEP